MDFRDEIAGARQKRPRVARQIGKLQRVRFRGLVTEDSIRGSEVALIDRPVDELPAYQQPIEVVRIDPQIRGVKACLEGGRAAENLDLALLGLGRRTKAHVAAPEQHEPRRALIGVGDEHGTVRQCERQILITEFQIVGGELQGGIERQPVEILHRAETSLIGNQPAGVGARVPLARELEPPRRHARAIAVFLEDVHDSM